MSVELNRFMTGTERQKVEDVLMRAAERNIKNEYGFYSLSGKKDCGLELYVDRNETELVNAILQKAVDRMPGPMECGMGGTLPAEPVQMQEVLGIRYRRRKASNRML